MEDCEAAIRGTGAAVSHMISKNSPELPAGCTMRPDQGAATYTGLLNTVAGGGCGAGGAVALQGEAQVDSVGVKVEHNTQHATLTMSGPATVWWGVGWDATTMADKVSD